jgi:hypothetical protein
MIEYQTYVNLIIKLVNLYFQKEISSEEIVYLIENIYEDISSNVNIILLQEFKIAYDNLDIPFFALDVNGIDFKTNLYGIDELNRRLKVFVDRIQVNNPISN